MFRYIFFMKYAKILVVEAQLIQSKVRSWLCDNTTVAKLLLLLRIL